MIKREASLKLKGLLREFPAVGLLGPRQVGKTTLALSLAESVRSELLYLDLERPSDLAKLQDPEAFLDRHTGKLVILDEIQRSPDLFPILRSVIDARRRKGQQHGQFLVLGSASLDLLRQTSESLAGRIAYMELTGLLASELPSKDLDKLWVRGGFPGSFLAKDDQASLRWRLQFISTYLEREVPQFGPRIPAVALRRLWTMLAHGQGSQLNMAKLASAMDLAAPTVKRYIELLEDLLLIRSLRPWSGNVGKRMVKAPKVYIRDSGITHALLNLATLDEVLGHPVAGASWEGFVIENLLAVLPQGASAWFYRTSAGAEIDLVIEQGKERLAIEVKRSSAPKLSRGFHTACEDIKATQRYVVHSGKESYPIGGDVMAMTLPDMMKKIRGPV
jgi:predicted AAA+ superfamily ATPase